MISNASLTSRLSHSTFTEWAILSLFLSFPKLLRMYNISGEYALVFKLISNFDKLPKLHTSDFGIGGFSSSSRTTQKDNDSSACFNSKEKIDELVHFLLIRMRQK